MDRNVLLVFLVFVSGCGGTGGTDDTDTADTVDDGDAVEESTDVPVDGPGDTSGEDGGGPDGGCTADGDCDDGDPCTADTCDTDAGECSHLPVDADGDGYPALEVDGTDCGGTDCDDGDDTRHPDASLDCEGGTDRNCDGLPDDDADGDGFISDVCPSGDDCDDEDDEVFPGSLAIDCSDTDHDCNGEADRDNDGDGHDRDDCPSGDDCDDEDPDVSPSASEVRCNGVDDDCNGELHADEDADADGYANAGCTTTDVDCDDGEDTIHPGATEICDDVDQDCDGSVLDAPGADDDGDGHLDEACGGDDCDDTVDTVYSGATEICDDVDQDCDGQWQDATGADDDGDDHLDEACGGDDCDDTVDTVFTAATELCDDVDQDCDGSVLDAPGADDDGDGVLDEACGGDDCEDDEASVNPSASEVPCDGWDTDCDGTMSVTEDGDGDGYANATCVASGNDPDCDDGEGTIHPGATEICDDVDQDCDGQWQDATGADDDGDDHLDEVCGGDDCDDTVDTVFTGATELCDLIDQDCDGSWADGGADDDGDDHLDEACGGDDCDDTLDTVHAGAAEVCLDGIDQDCDTLVDGPVVSGTELLVSDTPGMTGHAYDPWIVWTGSEFGVVWDDTSFGNQQIGFRTVDPSSGTMGPVRQVTDATGSRCCAEVTWTGSEYGLAWQDLRGSFAEVYFARLAADGTQIGTDVRVTETVGSAMYPTLAWSGSRFGIASTEEDVIRLHLLDATGTLVASDLTLTGGGINPSLAWSGSQWALAWVYAPTSISEIRFLLATASGVAITSEIRVTQGLANADKPSLLWTGSEYAIAWQDERYGSSCIEIVMARLDESGAKIGSDLRLSEHPLNSSVEPSIAWSGSEFATGWLLDVFGDKSINMETVSGDLSYSSSEVTVVSTASYTGAEQSFVSIDWSGSSWGVVWSDDRDVMNEIYYTSVEMCD